MRLAAIFTVLTAAILFSGCEVVRLSNGKYETALPGRSDFAAVYGDMIILRLRNPVDESGTANGSWDWGGTYSINEDNVIELDMDRETARKWVFYYELRRHNNGIRVVDHRAENAYYLNFIPAVTSAKRPAPSAYPSYQ